MQLKALEPDSKFKYGAFWVSVMFCFYDLHLLSPHYQPVALTSSLLEYLVLALSKRPSVSSSHLLFYPSPNFFPSCRRMTTLLSRLRSVT